MLLCRNFKDHEKMNRNRTSIFLYGASGHGKVIIDILEKEKMFQLGCIIDDNPSMHGNDFLGYPVIGGKSSLLSGDCNTQKGIIGIGDNKTRKMINSWLAEHNFTLVRAIHPSVQVGKFTEIAGGTVVMAGAVINSGSFIGQNTIINTKASVDHDCIIDDFVHVAPGATLCGSVKIGEGTFVGAGATIIQNITVGKNVTIGAGTVVVNNIPDNIKVIGPR